MIVVHGNPNNSMSDLAWAIPAGAAAIGGILAGWKGLTRIVRWYRRRRRFWDKIKGVPGESSGVLERMDKAEHKQREMNSAIKETLKMAERAGRTAIAAHKRMDRAGIPRSWPENRNGNGNGD